MRRVALHQELGEQARGSDLQLGMPVRNAEGQRSFQLRDALGGRAQLQSEQHAGIELALALVVARSDSNFGVERVGEKPGCLLVRHLPGRGEPYRLGSDAVPRQRLEERVRPQQLHLGCVGVERLAMPSGGRVDVAEGIQHAVPEPPDAAR